MDKDHILDEIRRTARANGGKALGHRRFATETGIGWNDWHGKHWVRWSDAVQEAGVESNTFEDAYEEDYLVKRLLDLTRELGRIPVHGDLRIKARNDATFPSDRPFRRMGPKSGWTAKMLALAQRDAQYADLVPLLAQDVANSVEADNTDSDGASESKQEVVGFVYMLRAGKHYKIGKTNAVGRRERQLAIQLPERADTVHVIKTDDPGGIEAYWHRRFADRRKNGEWMQVTVAAQDVSMEERPALALHVSDVTDRALSVALLEGQGRVLEMVARGSPLRRILSELVRTTESLSSGMLGSVMLLDDHGRLRLGAAPGLPRDYLAAIDAIGEWRDGSRR